MKTSFSELVTGSVQDVFRISDNKEKGIIEGIPFPFERFTDFMPSIEKGNHIGLLSGTGVGKSTFTRHSFVFHSLDFGKQNNYPVKVLYFALEDDMPTILKKCLSYEVFTQHAYEIPFWQMISKKRPLNLKEKGFIEKAGNSLKGYENSLYIIDSCATPTQILKAVNLAEETGAINKDKDHVIIVIDNFANITPDGDEKQWDAIGRLSKQIIRLDFCKKRNYSVVSILQQDIQAERHAFMQANKATLAAVEPSLANISDNKTIARDFHIMLGLFNPHRYDILKYPNNEGYEIDILKDEFRSLLLLKSNLGATSNARLGLRFRGAAGYFNELPRADDQEALNLIYTDIKQREILKKQGFVQTGMFGKV